MSAERRLALVTGANRGIGLEVARQLARDHGMTAIVGARDPAKGEAAAAQLAAEGLSAEARQLDVADPNSVHRLFGEIEDDHGRLDVLVNNAGVAGDTRAAAAEVDLDEVKEVLESNTFGAWRCAQAAAALMRRGGFGRVVNVSSGMGQLSDMGAGAPAYRLSKTGLSVITQLLAGELRGEGVLVNQACPGWVRTDMGGAGASRSVEEGADTPVWLATLPDDGPTGGFFRDRRPIPW